MLHLWTTAQKCESFNYEAERVHFRNISNKQAQHYTCAFPHLITHYLIVSSIDMYFLLFLVTTSTILPKQQLGRIQDFVIARLSLLLNSSLQVEEKSLLYR
jgi:hypothetical protein